MAKAKRIKVELTTPRGKPKGFYYYERETAATVRCWKQGTPKKNSYRLTWLGNSWYCDCPAMKVCSHILGCPWAGEEETFIENHVDEDLFAMAAKNAFTTLPNGRFVNVYEHFWQKGGKK